MKRFRPTLKKQVEEVLGEIVIIFEEIDKEFTFKYKEKIFKICKIEYGFNAGCNANNYSWEFIKDCRGVNYGFIDSFNCEYVDMIGFSNEDIIFLAENIEEILQKINDKLEKDNEGMKPLIGKLKKIQEALK